MDAQTVALVSLAVTTASGFGVWGLKLWGDNILARAKTMSDLALAKEKSATDAELARLNAGLRTYESRFTRLHEKQSEIVAMLYTQLVDLEDAALNYLPGPRFDDAAQARFRQCLTDVSGTVARTAIYFDEVLIESLHKLIRDTKGAELSKIAWQGSEPNQMDAGAKESFVREMKTRYKTVTEDLPLLKGELANNFRSLLGVDSLIGSLVPLASASDASAMKTSRKHLQDQ